MENILKIINQIETTSSRNEKENILKKNSDNTLLKDLLYFVYNPYIVTGISEKKFEKLRKTNISIADVKINDIYSLMEYLKTNNTGRDEDLKQVLSFIMCQKTELQELYKQIVTKNLKIGITSKTINKIYGKNFIPEFNVMLAEKYFDNEDKVKGNFIITTKLDGGRVVLIKENGSIKFFTRQGQVIEDLVEITEEAMLLPDNMVYDGELLLRNDKGLESKDLYRATMKETRKDGIKKNLIFNCFDVLPVQDFKNGICKTPCIERKEQLHSILSSLQLKTIIEVPMLYIGNDKNKIMQLLDEARSKHDEGVMLNISDSPYECKRTKNLLKVKVMQSADLKIIGFEEGTNKYENSLGSVIVDYKGYKVGVGSGFSDNDRTFIWQHKDELLGRVIEVSYFEETQNQDGGISLRFPVFKGIRENGKEVSYY